ncbi:hypothetical protein ACJJIX_20720 [Microbulbifer sp. VAAC004]|uniref:hypothetical protein n=1 Tax=unclassified Microbulbifer TaxID=2619833 RepID=UPI0040399B8A
MNRLERILYDNDRRWFFLESLNYDEAKNSVEIVIYPNNEEISKRHFVFNGVSRFSYECDEECELAVFPKQIIGIDWNNERQVVINCAEVEFSFYTSENPKYNDSECS